MDIDNPVSDTELAAILAQTDPDIDNLFGDPPSPQALSQDATTPPTTPTQHINIAPFQLIPQHNPPTLILSPDPSPSPRELTTTTTTHITTQIPSATPTSTTYTETHPNPNLTPSKTFPQQNQPCTSSLTPIPNPSPQPSTTSPHPQTTNPTTNPIPNTSKTHTAPHPKTPQTPHITSTATTHTISTTVQRLVELNHLKSQHNRQLTILSKHITNHTTPSGLTITMQPWVELSQKHKEAWDNSLQDCMSTLTNILHQHHTEQLEKVQNEISSHSSNITQQYPKDVSKTILGIATTTTPHRPQRRSRPKTKPKRKLAIQPPSTKPTTHSIQKPPLKRTKTTESNSQHQGFRTRPQRQNQPNKPPNPPAPTIPPPPPPVSNVTRETICRRLVGNQSKFPIIYGMLMKGGQ